MNENKLQYVVSVEVFENEQKLSADDRALIGEAAKAMQNAYAPYSQFKVGAALLLDNGKIVSGNNQENAAYPSGLCAERVALFYAGAQFGNVAIKTLAVLCDAKTDEPVTPCGACRQVIAEYEQLSNRKIRILMGVPNGKIYLANGIETLLPFMFGKRHLLK